MSLPDIYQRLSQQGGTVTLNDASLGSTGFGAFLLAQLQISSVQVTLSAPLQPPGASLVFGGTSTFLYAGGNGLQDGNPYTVQVTITEPGSTPVLGIAVSLSNGWVLGNSFFPFTGSAFDGSVVTAPALALSWGAGKDGLNFSAQLNLVGPLGILPWLFTTPPGSLAFGGQVQLTTNGPAFAFNAPLPSVRGLLGTVQLDQPVYGLSLAWVPTDYDDGPPFLPQLNSVLGGVVGNVLPNPVPFVADLAIGSNHLVLELGDTGTQPALNGVDQLGNFFGGQSSGFPGQLTPTVFSLPAGVALKQLVVQLDLSRFPYKLLSLGGTVGTTQVWYPIPGVSQFSINPLDLTWTLVEPGGSNYLFANVAAHITIGTYSFDAEVSYPDFVVGAHLPGGVTLGLGEINSQLFTSFPNNRVPANPDLSGSSVTFGEFDVVLATKAKTFELSCQAEADIQIGSLDLGLQSGSLDLLLDFSSGGSAQSRFSVAGVFSVNQWQFLISATIQQSGLLFSGSLTQPQTIRVSDLLGQLLQGQVSAPSQFNLSVTMQSFGLELDTAQGLLDVNGRLNWSLTVCGKTFEPQFAIHVTSTGKGAARQWSGQLAGQMTLAGGTFLLAYNFAPSVSKLTGAWSSGSYDWLTAVGDFGQAMPPLPAPMPAAQNPNLSANGALIVSYDFATDVFTLQGQAQGQNAGMTGFLLVVPASIAGGASRGFAAGIQFELRPGFFTSLSSALAMFDAFGLTGTFGLAVANFNNSQYVVPLKGQNAFPGVVKGIALYGSFNWQQADATTHKAIASLTSNNSSLNVMLAFYQPSGGGFVFKFAGKLSDVKLSLGSSVDVNSVALALQMSTAIPFQVEFDIDLTVHPGTGWVSRPGESDPLLYFRGQLLFQATKAGGVGGSAAVFMPVTWHEPFNIQGLTVGNLGLLLGVAVTDGVPLPSFGLTGLMAYMTPDLQFDVVVAIYFNGADPTQSLFVGSIKELSAVMLLQMMLWAADGVRVPSLLQSALGNYGVVAIPFDLDKGQTQLTQADFDALNDYQVPSDFFKLACDVGMPIQQPLQGAKYSTLTVILQDSKNPKDNTTWYIADFQTGHVFVLNKTAPSATTYTLALQPWLYVVPTTTSIGPWQYTQGYGFGGALKLPGLTLKVIAQLAPSLGLAIDANAPKPLTYPFDPTGTFQLPALLTFSSASDPTLGPTLSLSTYQNGLVPPHFYLDAKLSLLNLASLSAQVRILSSGLAFDLSFDVLTAQAKLSCMVGDGAFAAAGSFTVTLEVHTSAVEVGGVTVIPAIDLNTGFGVSLSVGFATQASSAQNAALSGSIFFVWQGQSFSASFSITLNDLTKLAEELVDWIENNIGELLKSLLNDVVAWATALANGLFEMTTELATAALKALGALADEAAALLADIGRDVTQVYNAIKTVFGLTDAQTVWAITRAFRFDIAYVGLGQHIGPSDGSGGDVSKLLAWMQNTAGPAFAAGQWQALPAPGTDLLAVTSASLLGGMVQIETAMFDPALYAMRLRGMGLDMLLPYQRLSDSQGVFSGSTPASTELVNLGFGPFGFRHPAVTVSVFTDGSFEINYGYPDGGDWSRAGGLQTPVFSGQGGFKVARLAAGTSLPDWPPVSIAVRVDAILRASWHVGIDIGILSGGAWVNYSGGFSALAGYGDGITPSQNGQFNPSQPAQFAGQLFMGMAGGIYGSVNFGIVQASVSASYSVVLGLPFGANQSIPLTARVTVRAGASIRINLLLFSITIHFSFSITLTLGSTLVWPQAQALALAGPAGPMPPLRFRRAAALPAGAPAPATPTTPTTPLPLWFVPELTLVNGSLQAVFGLTIPFTPQAAGCAFNQLVRALLQWAMSLDEEQPQLSTGQPFALARLQRVAWRLRAKQRLSRAYGSESLQSVLDYPTLVSFLSSQFVVQVGLPPSAGGASNQAVAFPMVPDLMAQAVPGSGTSYTTVTDFASFNLQPPAYEDAIVQAFEAFRVGATTAPPASGSGNQSVATYLFVAYFEFLLQGGAQAALDALRAAGQPENADISPALWATTTFDDLAGSAAASFRGGLQLPASDQASAAIEPMYQVTGQQVPVGTALLPPSGFSTQLAAGAAGSWLSVQTTVVALDAAYLTAHNGITVQAPLTPTALPPLLSSASQFGFSAFISLDAGTLMAVIPDALNGAAQAAPLAISLLTKAVGADPVPLALPFAWATGLSVTIAQVSQADGSVAAGVYRLTACNPQQAAAIAALAALEQQKTGNVTLSLVYPSAGGFATAAAAAALLCTNLSTRSQPPQARAVAPTAPAIAGPLSDAGAALAVFAAYVSTNNDGYYLATTDAGLAAAFGSSGALGVQILAQRTVNAGAVLASDTCLVLQGALPAQSALLAQADGLPQYAPANAPGMLQLSFTRPNPNTRDPAGSNQQWLDLLFNLLTLQVDADTHYAAHGFAPPVSPQTPTGSTNWLYTLSVPLTKLLATSSDNPYAAIGTSPNVVFQLRDGFGNAVPNAAPVQQPAQCYTDALISPAAWPGCALQWLATGSNAGLTLSLSVEAGALAANKSAALGVYQLAGYQLAMDADVQLALSSSLDDADPTVLPVADLARLQGFVAAVIAYLLGEGTLPTALDLSYTLAQPTLANPPLAIGVELLISRVANVDAAAAALLPTIASVAAPVAADMSAGLTAFATAFEATLPGLKLATGAAQATSVTLYAVAKALTQPTIGSPDVAPYAQAPDYFSPAPLYADMRSGQVQVPQYGDFGQGSGWPTSACPYSAADCDQLAATSFALIDSLLGGAFAAAAYAANPTGLQGMVADRAAIAQAYTNGKLGWLFQQQAQPDPANPTLWGARVAFSSALQNALASAYAMAGVAALPVSVPSAAGTTLALYGTVQPAGGSNSPAASPCPIKLGSGATQATLFYPYRPASTTAQAALSQGLEMVLTHMALGDIDAPNPTWLMLALPPTIAVAGGADVVLPVVDRYFPPTPTLGSQTWQATQPGGSTLDELAQWTYGTSAVLQPVAQDSACFDLQFNLTTAPVLAAQTAPPMTVADALVRFQGGYAQIAPVLAQVQGGTPQAGNIVAALADLIHTLATASDWASGSTQGRGGSRYTAAPGVKLTAQLSASLTVIGAWLLVVEAAGAPMPGTLTAIPCSADGTPQPGITVLSQSPLTVQYTPVDTTAPVLIRLALSGMDVRLVQSAWSQVQVTRNADLFSGVVPPVPYVLSTETAYVFTTPQAGFPSLVNPALNGPTQGLDIASLVTPPADTSLKGWLAALLAASLGTAPAPRAASLLRYSLPAFVGTDGDGNPASAFAPSPRLMTRTLDIDNSRLPPHGSTTPATLAKSLADPFNVWMHAWPVNRQRGLVSLDFALFPSSNNPGPALLVVPNLYLALNKLKAETPEKV